MGSAVAPLVGRDVDAVLFDVGGVITLPDPVSFGTALTPLGATATLVDLVRAHYVGMAAHAASDLEGRGPWRDYVEAYLDVAGVPDDRRDDGRRAFARVFGHHCWRFPLVETVSAMEQLSYLGVPLGVVSNAAGHVEALIRNLNLCQVGPGGGVSVEIVVDSGVVGVEKPDPEVFAPAPEVMAARGVRPERIAYVGDSLRYDVAGARAAAVVPVLLDPYDLYQDVDLGPGASRVGSVHDLLPPPVRPERHPEAQLEPEAD
ncbi:hypothetical protein BH24ACT4_BH24ACT4_10940 [soil metagenome]